MIRRIAILLGASLLAPLCGCTVGPDYHPPRLNVPSGWSELHEERMSVESPDISRWWTLFKDPELNSLIDRAVAANFDLKIAKARIREARAQRRAATAALYPAVDVSGSYTRIRVSESALGISPSTQGGGANPLALLEGDLYQAGFDASWEIDIFGGVRRSVEAANADVEVWDENCRDVLVTLLSEVARNYFEVRGSQARIAVAHDNVAAQQKTLELTKVRFQAGVKGELDVAQAKAQLASMESQVPVLETSAKQAMHQLAVLSGLDPGALLGELSQFDKNCEIPAGPERLPIGLPSGLLRRRPDVRRVERQIAAATARIGVATADLFPRFSLTGSLGQQSLNFSDIALPESRFWSIGPGINWPVFDAGRIRANIEVQDARQEQALKQYEKTVLTALQEVENSLIAYGKERDRQVSLIESVSANRRAVELAEVLYSKGNSDFLNVLESQRSLYLSEEQLVESKQKISTNLAALFKALGGGWEIPPQETPVGGKQE